MLRELIRPIDALRLRNWSPVWSRGVLHRGPCPVHGSRDTSSRSLSITDRVVYCHRCHFAGDAVALWAKLHGLPVLEAAYALCQELRISPPYLT